MKKIAIAGSTGYLGKCIAEALVSQNNINGLLLARNLQKLEAYQSENITKVKVELTDNSTLPGVLYGVDTVISTVGITRQKDGLSYMDVDYGANHNLLQEAKKAGVRKFVYVSVLNGQNMRNLKICEAKEHFVDELKASGLAYTIIRPNGFSSDLKDFLNMAQKGKVYLFGTGKSSLNPIHGADLARVCLDSIHTNDEEIEVGGPEVFTQNQIASLALKTLHQPVKIVHLPDWIRVFTLGLVRTFLPSKIYGPIEFFLSAMASDMIAPKYGIHKLGDYYQSISHEFSK
nr:SDR family oxidoreductase [uncultured Carboxylicivirga sp.]